MERIGAGQIQELAKIDAALVPPACSVGPLAVNGHHRTGHH
jgi:hypothetical protein